MKYAVVFGNAFDGMSLIGPFDTSDEALEYGDDSGDPWVLVEMEEPETK